MVVGGETTLLVKQGLGVADILVVATIGAVRQSQGEILQGGQHRIEVQHPVDGVVAFHIGAVSQDNVLGVGELSGHVLQPVNGRGGTFGIREDHILIFGTTDTNGEGVFVAPNAGDSRIQVDNMDVVVLLLILQ